MAEPLKMEAVFKVDGYGLIIHFNDGTEARYTVNELANMRPNRLPVEKVPEVAP